MPLGMWNATTLKRAPLPFLPLPLLPLCRSLVLAVLMLAWGLMESSLAPKNSGRSLSASPNKTAETIYCACWRLCWRAPITCMCALSRKLVNTADVPEVRPFPRPQRAFDAWGYSSGVQSN